MKGLRAAVQSDRIRKTTQSVHPGLAGRQKGLLGPKRRPHCLNTLPLPSLPPSHFLQREPEISWDPHRLEREGEGAWEPEAWLGAQLCDTRILEKVAEGPGHRSLPGQLGTERGGSGFTSAWCVTWAPTGQQNDVRPWPLQSDTFHQETAILSLLHRDRSGPDFGSCGLEEKRQDLSQGPRAGA